MTRYIDADALKLAIPPTVSSTLSPVEIVLAMINAAPTVTPPVTPPPVATTPPNGSLPPYRTSKSLVFSAPYSDAQNWVSGRSSAYPAADASGYQKNLGDSKLDLIGPLLPRPTDAGVFTATRYTGAATAYKGTWLTQLMTTEGSAKGFKVKTGDVVAFDVTPSADTTDGVWSGIWTWAGPSNELDFMEYHSDNPSTIELTNHVRSSLAGYPKALAPGKASHVEVVCGSTSVQWWIDGVNVFNDTGGVGSGWSAYLIVNLSVAAGNQFHPGPPSTATSLTATLANVKVYR